MHRILKTATISQIADPRIAVGIGGQELAGPPQSQLAHVMRDSFAMLGEHAIEMGARTTQLPRDQFGVQSRRAQMPPNEDLRRGEQAGVV